MKVILLQNIRGIGQLGDVKDVRDGYARNFLLPRKLAKTATSKSLKEAEELKKNLAEALKIENAKALEISEKLKDVTLNITERANSSGTLFAAVGKHEIMVKLKESTGYEVNPDNISIEEHAIKTVGEHMVKLELTDDVSVPIKVIVTAESEE